MNFGVISEKRNALKISVTEMCRKAGIGRNTYYRLVENPDSGQFDTISRLVKALDLTDEEKIRLFN